MASVVGICNSALSKIGAATRISSLTEGTEEANACNEQYTKLRDDLLRSHDWNFARARQKLAQLSTDPVYGYDHAYQLPADWLRTIAVHDNDAGHGRVPYKIEGNTLVTDVDDVWMTYIKQVTDPNLMTPDFRECLSLKLAADLAMQLAESNTIMENMIQLFDRKLQRIKGTDAIEDWHQQLPEGSWATERTGPTPILSGD